jgi:hypothetical protein
MPTDCVRRTQKTWLAQVGAQGCPQSVRLTDVVAEPRAVARRTCAQPNDNRVDERSAKGGLAVRLPSMRNSTRSHMQRGWHTSPANHACSARRGARVPGRSAPWTLRCGLADHTRHPEHARVLGARVSAHSAATAGPSARHHHADARGAVRHYRVHDPRMITPSWTFCGTKTALR